MHSPSNTRNSVSKKPRRSYVACGRCHAQKIKCSGETPCRGCLRSSNSSACVYPVRERKVMVLEGYLKQLEDDKEKAEARARQLSATAGPTTPDPSVTPSGEVEVEIAEVGVAGVGIDEQDGEEDVAKAEVANPVLEQRVSDSQHLSKPVYVGASTCTAFANLLRQHVKGHGNHDGDTAPPPARIVRVFEHDSLQRVNLRPLDQLPNYAYATTLVHSVLRFIGRDYHLLRKRTFLQQMDLVYSDSSQARRDPGLLCRMFIVFALGELYLRKPCVAIDGRREVPGTSFYLQAVSLFHDQYEEPDVEYIQTLLLFSFYSYALNRKNSAYTYAGLALRLSMSLGLHRNITYASHTSRVEIENRRRVWWTVYTFDRLTSSKLGHPVMIKDEDIDAPYPSSQGLTPSEQEEFIDATQMILNVKLAQITSSILDYIYRIHSPTQENAFVRNVHRILTSLKEWDASLPPEIRLDHTKTPPYSHRSVASLRLHFNQGIILTTRPVLLYVCKTHLSRCRSTFSRRSSASSPSEEAGVNSGSTNGSSTNSSASDATPTPRPSPPTFKPLSPTTVMLGEACIYAARATTRLIQQLWIDGAIATFGYFDAHYIFSSVVVLMVSVLLSPGSANDADRNSIDLSRRLLRCMADDGNLPAAEFCDRLASLQRDLDEAVGRLGGLPGGGGGGDSGRGDGLDAAMLFPERGYLTASGTFAAHVVPASMGNLPGPVPPPAPSSTVAQAAPRRQRIGVAGGRGSESDSAKVSAPPAAGSTKNPVQTASSGGGGSPWSGGGEAGHAFPSITPSSASASASSGVVLDDPFIRDFLGQSDSQQWSPGAYDMTSDEMGIWSLAWGTDGLSTP